MPALKWIDENLERVLASCLLAIIVILISANVFMRYIMEASLSWGEELTLWVFVWFVWLATSYAFRKGAHVRITIIRDGLGHKAKSVFDIIADILIFIFLAILTYECIKLINLPFVANQTSVVLGLPIPALYASAPIGAILSSIRVLQHLFATIKKMNKKEVLDTES